MQPGLPTGLKWGRLGNPIYCRGYTVLIQMKVAMADCQNCGVRDASLFSDLNEQDFSLIHAPIDHLVFQAGARL